MNCFFIGHRDAPHSLALQLDECIERHITQYKVHEFIVGNRGDFDRQAISAVKRAKKRHPHISLVLLLAYHPFDCPAELTSGFDDSFYPPGMELVPKRAAIIRANEYMVKTADFLIAYDRRLVGNTRTLVDLARRREKQGFLHVENLAQLEQQAHQTT